jgi:glycine cleavage system T protein
MGGEDYLDFLFGEEMDELDEATDLIIDLEGGRQARKLILIPSESICPPAVRQALASPFTNIYAEGYPPARMSREGLDLLTDYRHQMAYYRRYSDRRFYKGTEFADLVEALAQRRAAQRFATPEVPEEQIFVNVQPLSGAAANNAVYEAFVEPGETVMGMALPHGGHLTHGSQFNRSGKRYNAVSYAVDPGTGRLDYDAIEALAIEHRPQMIIAGFTSYPWAVDWARFRRIADAVPGDTILLADIAHPAGMVISGTYPSPVGYADVITFTTHKTLCGPRGAVILTTDPERAMRIDQAVFPGEQGGPHVNKFAAMAVAFQIAGTRRFRDLQFRIVENARALADSLQHLGLRLAYGGTDTHLLVVDLNSVETDTGYGLKGDPAARILDLCGLVCNKNTIPGDETAADASGIRLGTPWISQRGLRPQDMDKVAEAVHRVLTHIRPFSYIGATGDLYRGKIDLEVMESVRRDAAGMTEGLSDADTQKATPSWEAGVSESPPALFMNRTGAGATPQGEAVGEGTTLQDLTDGGVVEVRGWRARSFLQQATTADVLGLEVGRGCRSLVLDRAGDVLDELMLMRRPQDAQGRDIFWILTYPKLGKRTLRWLQGLADGYVLFDDEDILRKVEGPVDFRELQVEGQKVAVVVEGTGAEALLESVIPDVLPLEDGDSRDAEVDGHPVVVFRDPQGEDALRLVVVASPDAARWLWERLDDGDGLQRIGWQWEDARRRREGLPTDSEVRVPALDLYRAGLDDRFDVHKHYFVAQAALKPALPPDKKEAFYVQEGEVEGPERTSLHEEHQALGGRMVPFAGWEMPVWYTSIADEHRAVREAAGLFDVGHMGILEVAGECADRLLDAVSTNYVPWLSDGQVQYSYMLDPRGSVMDDILVYRLAADRYMVVVNAVNARKIESWLRTVQDRRVEIDPHWPWREVEGEAEVRNLKDLSSRDDRLMDIALQGPRSLEVLSRTISDGSEARKLSCLERFDFARTRVDDTDVLVSRTGYTGEKSGFELYVHPDGALALWRRLLQAGEELGLRPAGLGARDSTRTEAGLPLYGHELAGPLDITPLGAGYGSFVKFHKPFFIGRQALLARERDNPMRLVRFRLEERGGRMIRPQDPVVDGRGQHIGSVTSCALVEGRQMGMAYVNAEAAGQGDAIGIFPMSRRGKERLDRGKEDLALGDRILLHSEALVLSRFPEPDEDG